MEDFDITEFFRELPPKEAAQRDLSMALHDVHSERGKGRRAAEAKIADAIARGADIDGREFDDERTPLMIAAGCGYTHQVGLLIKLGADVGARSALGHDALSIACAHGQHLKAVELLAKAGAPLDRLYPSKRDPSKPPMGLHAWTRQNGNGFGNAELVVALLEAAELSRVAGARKSPRRRDGMRL